MIFEVKLQWWFWSGRNGKWRKNSIGFAAWFFNSNFKTGWENGVWKNKCLLAFGFYPIFFWFFDVVSDFLNGFSIQFIVDSASGFCGGKFFHSNFQTEWENSVWTKCFLAFGFLFTCGNLTLIFTVFWFFLSNFWSFSNQFFVQSVQFCLVNENSLNCFGTFPAIFFLV